MSGREGKEGGQGAKGGECMKLGVPMLGRWRRIGSG